ncbi:MAG TPA: NAD(P)H-hydrate dehydratase [Dermatophilaceae bacterium]|nr:NAD(P)H-hydrate dehydratase [Dermatophilaceae bacterium]
MIEAYAPDAVRAAEAALMARLPEGELMQRASLGLAEVAAARMEERGGSTVVALAGPGNNGADALYAVAHLAREGFNAAAVHTDRVHAPAKAAAEEAGVLLALGDDPFGLARVHEADVVLDGILGLGARAGLPDWARPWLDAVPENAWLIAVDLPSGADPAGLSPAGPPVFADETVTFAVAKPVHLLPPSDRATGQLSVVDIGLDLSGTTAIVQRLTFDDASGLWPVPGPDDDKYARGVLGLVAGGEGYTGAAILSATAAVSAGVGMVRYLGPPTPESLIRAAVPEVVFGSGQVQAWVIGPGLDTRSASAEQLDAAEQALASDLPVLLDAGGLELVTGPRSAPTLLTPHAGELARLLARLTGAEVTRAAVSERPTAKAQEAADLTGATVLLKGSTTLVVPPQDSGHPMRAQADAPGWTATAGAGDVLAGLAGTLLAAGLDPLDAGSLAALVHGVAADQANPGGPVRALAIAHGIPRAVATLLARR